MKPGGNARARVAGLAVAGVLLAACSRNPPPALPAPQPAEPAEPEPPPAFYEEGVASWYGPGFDGRLTASGEVFFADSLTAAHPRLPFGTLLRVVNLDNGREIVVRINDRGPFVEGRILDLSRAAARALGMEQAGVARVRIFLEQQDEPAPADTGAIRAPGGHAAGAEAAELRLHGLRAPPILPP